MLEQVREYAAKEVRFGVECRTAILAGVDKLADAVEVTLGPKVSQSQSLCTDTYHSLCATFGRLHNHTSTIYQ